MELHTVHGQLAAAVGPVHGLVDVGDEGERLDVHVAFGHELVEDPGRELDELERRRQILRVVDERMERPVIGATDQLEEPPKVVLLRQGASTLHAEKLAKLRIRNAPGDLDAQGSELPHVPTAVAGILNLAIDIRAGAHVTHDDARCCGAVSSDLKSSHVIRPIASISCASDHSSSAFSITSGPIYTMAACASR